MIAATFGLSWAETGDLTVTEYTTLLDLALRQKGPNG